MKVDSDAGRPFPYADPRSLSRAWFDALYQQRPPSCARPPSVAAVNQLAFDMPAGKAHAQMQKAGGTGASDSAVATTALQSDLAGTGTDREPNSSGARNVRRGKPLDVSPETETAEANGRLDVACSTTDGASLRLLLEHDAGRVNVVAVCDERSAARMTDVLERARIALAARGVAITTRLIHSEVAP